MAASAVNINVVLVFLKTSATLQYYTALVSLLALLVVAAALLWNSYTLPVAVLAWALFGVYSELKQPSDLIVETFQDTQIATIRTLAASLCGIVAVAVVATLARQGWTALRERRSHTDEEAQYIRAPNDNHSE